MCIANEMHVREPVLDQHSPTVKQGRNGKRGLSLHHEFIRLMRSTKHHDLAWPDQEIEIIR